MRVFISYHTPDTGEADRLRAALSVRSPGLDLYFAPARNTLGAYWLPRLGEELQASDAVLLVLGDKLGPWQELEYYEAMRLSRRSGRPLIVPVVIGKVAPGLQFLDLHHQLFAHDRPLEDIVGAALRAFDGLGMIDQEPPWRRYNPYKGLSALGTEDARFFFGRETITGDILDGIRRMPDRVLALIGNSGVGKSSLAQAGVIASLRSQVWAGDFDRTWPSELEDSRSWLAVTITPGEAPLKELAYGLVRIWARGGEAEREARNWADLLATGSGIEDLMRNTADEIEARANDPPPRRFLLYIDQGEELYARSDIKQAKRFSELIAAAVTRPEIVILASLRSDYYGCLQADEPLFALTERFDVPPLNHAGLEAVIRRPATTLGARFETEEVIPMIAGSAAREPGSLPLLSYLMTDTWNAMRSEASDGVMRFPLDMVDVSRPLAERAERFLAGHPDREAVVRYLFCLKLAHVPMDGEPVRRRARKAECSVEEWQIVEQLAGADWRLLSIGSDETDVMVEVAHEALLRKWPRLTRWLEEEREFLVWKGQLEQTRRQYEAMADADKKGALLMGTPLMLARSWVAERAADLGPQDRAFIDRSIAAARRGARRTMIGGAIALVLALVAGASGWMAELQRREVGTQRQIAEIQRRQVLVSLSEQQTASGNATEGVRLALQALGKDPGGDRPYVPQAEAALYAALYQHREEQILQAHRGVVWSVGFSPDGQHLVTAGEDGTAWLWDPATGAGHLSLDGHAAAVRSAVFSPDGERVVTASDDGEARVWLTASGEVELALSGHDGPVHYATFSPDAALVLTASADRRVRLWNASSGDTVAVLLGHDQAVTYAAFSPDGRVVVSASRDGTGRLWDVATGQIIHVLQGHKGPVAFAAFSPDGRLVVTASDDTTARIWNVATGHGVHTLSGHQGRVRTALFSPDGKGVITSSDDRTARLWHAAESEVVAVLQGHERGVGAVAFSPDGRRLVAGTDSGTVHLWDAITGESIAVLRGHEGQVQSVSFSPDGRRVATASDDGTVRLWNATREANFMTLEGHDDRVRGAAFSPDGQAVVSASADGTVRLWDTDEGTVIAERDAHEGQVLTVAFSCDGKRLVTGSEDGTARVWDAATGDSLAVLEGHAGWVRAAAFSPDGRRIVTASGDRTARQWDAASGETLAVLQRHDDMVLSAAFSPDGKRIVTASADHTARLWDAETNEPVLTLLGHEGPVRSAAFSSNGRLVVTASDDTTARLWNADTGEPIRVFQGHGREVRSAALSPDDLRVVTGSIDRTARIWDTATGENVAQLIGHKAPVQHTSFSADGLRVLTASSDGTLRIWSVFPTTQALVDQANRSVPQQLDPHAQAVDEQVSSLTPDERFGTGEMQLQTSG